MIRECDICGRPYRCKYSKINSKFCSKGCQNRHRKSPLIRFWRYVTQSSGCWEWLGCKDKDGYGVIHSGLSAHRYAFELFLGPIPSDKLVRHSCNNSSCVNPNHLLLGTTLDNSRDMVNSGRSLVGERNPRAKLTRTQIRSIISARKSGFRVTDIALKYQVSSSLVYQILRGVIWK